MKNYLSMRVVALLCVLLIAPVTGCGTATTQAQVTTVVTDIANWTPIISSDATVLLNDLSSFEPADAAALQAFITKLNSDSTALTALCKQYLAAPSDSLLTQISALVGDLATTDSSALLAVLQIKNANSQVVAKGVLTTIATAVTILEGYLATVKVTPTAAVKASLEQMKPFVNRTTLSTELAKAQNQGLVPASVTMERIGY